MSALPHPHPKIRNTRFENTQLAVFCALICAFVSRTAEAGSGRSGGRKELLAHLVFVEFQYTTCLFAAAAEMKLKRKTVAVHAGTAPGVRATEPMLISAAAGGGGGPVGANTGGERGRGGKKERRCICSCLSNLLKCREGEGKKKLRVTCCRVT